MTSIDNMDNFLRLSKEYYNNNVKLELKDDMNGKYIAVSYEAKKYWLGDSMTEALKNAKREYPEKLFYVIQIGSDAVFSIQTMGKKSI